MGLSQGNELASSNFSGMSVIDLPTGTYLWTYEVDTK
jgi:hypothetical protein